MLTNMLQLIPENSIIAVIIIIALLPSDILGSLRAKVSAK